MQRRLKLKGKNHLYYRSIIKMILLSKLFKKKNAGGKAMTFWTPVFNLLPLVHSTSWKCSLPFVDIFRTYWTFLIKFCSSDPSFNRNILRSQYLKFQTSAHVHIAITYVYVLFTNFLSLYEF